MEIESTRNDLLFKHLGQGSKNKKSLLISQKRCLEKIWKALRLIFPLAGAGISTLPVGRLLRFLRAMSLHLSG
jgi:hypothetical protein